MIYSVKLNEEDMTKLNRGEAVVYRVNGGISIAIVGKLTKKYSTYGDKVVEGLELKYGKGNF